MSGIFICMTMLRLSFRTISVLDGGMQSHNCFHSPAILQTVPLAEPAIHRCMCLQIIKQRTSHDANSESKRSGSKPPPTNGDTQE